MNEQNENININFIAFISGLTAEGLMALGLMKNPLTQEVHKDLKHASMVIDTLCMLQEKTKGNLNKEESDSLEQVLHQLRMAYVAMLKEDEKVEDKVEVEKKEKTEDKADDKDKVEVEEKEKTETEDKTKDEENK